ncbi:uncharacterized protein LOC123667682 [Melitaea cinxia]|uniref:uncharacterized protein LOC123667682 n=1 Tax=Melitaea cinxia TaxID=113334 RepID=UPI001E273977|nr:uncharacterized protein LOC123667682 [Melitaea cinxia]
MTYQGGNGIQSHNIKKNHEYVKVNNHKENNAKCKREENGAARDIYNNFENKLIDIKCDNSLSKQSIRREDNKNIKTSKTADNNNQISKSSKRKKNLDVEEKNKIDNIEKPKMKMKSSKKSKKNKNSNKKSKNKETANSISKDPTSEADKVKDDKKTADVEVCFDINEDYNREEITLEAPQLFGDSEWVQLNADDDSSDVYIAPVSDDYVPDIRPEIPDEYYPDFTSDKTYLSKEEYEYNFHDRHYYNSDNKAEMSIESRRYEHIDGRNSKHFDDVTDDVITRHDKNSKQNKNHKSNILSSELEFRTPPPLLFPDFKTEMINRDSFTSRSEYHQVDNDENYSDSRHHYKIPFYDLKESKPLELDNKNQVETVFAHSKVIKYGNTPNKEDISSIASKTTRNDDKNLFSTDGKTTVIIARSLGYPGEY